MKEELPPLEDVEQSYKSVRLKTMEQIEEYSIKSKWDIVALCWSGASTDIFGVGLMRWRRTGADPSPDFRTAIADALELVKYIDHLPPYERSPATVDVFQVMYAQHLLNEPIAEAFRAVTAVPSSERSLPTPPPDGFARDYLLVFDDLLLEMVERFEVPAEWDTFSDWLAEKKQPRNILNTMAAYKAIVESAHADDAKALARWVKKAHTNFMQRGKVTNSWGGPGMRDIIVDFRLGALLKSAAKANPEAMQGIESFHLWRWG